jgi:phosphatidylserine/phosphatidylglycerophosphate/cardiolipin synthase-like enzyme
MLVTSKNFVDSTASYFHDESVIIAGPAAAVAQLLYLPDIEASIALALAERTIDQEKGQRVRTWINNCQQRLAFRQYRVAAGGHTAVKIIQANANDSVRNLEHGILALINKARKSIEVYGRMIYNVNLAQALVAAIGRGVKVRLILDGSTHIGQVMNSILPKLLVHLGAFSEECATPVRWFKPFPAVNFPAAEHRPPLIQEIHAKTMIIDGTYALFGSANFDGPSWTGGFRELSVIVKDALVAKQALRVFDLLWHSDRYTTAHATIQGQLTGGDLLVRDVAHTILEAESKRIHAIEPHALPAGRL